MNQLSKNSITFTIGQATQMLPLVKSIVAEVLDLINQVKQTRLRLNEVMQIRIAPDEQEDVYRSEVLDIEDNVRQQEQRIKECIAELNDLAIDVRRIEAGFIDFPATRLGQPIFLCWQQGEQEVAHWHMIDEDCAQRQKVDLELIRQVGKHAVL